MKGKSLIALLAACLGANAFAAEAPLLRDGVQGKKWEIVHLDNAYQADVTYSRHDRYFLVQGTRYQKLDASGKVVYSVERTADTYRVPLSPFIVSPEGVYDFSRPQPELQPVVQVVNGDPHRSFTRDSWREIFDRAYRDADVVVYAPFDLELEKQPAYMRIKNSWVLFYTTLQVADFDVDYELGTSIEGFPQKFPRLTLLRDPNTGEFSAESSPLRTGARTLPESHLRYRPIGAFKWISYKKQKTFDREYFTGIPLSFTGNAVFQITLEDDALRFRETATSSLLGRRKSRINWYVLPVDLAQSSPISFLEFMPYGSADTQGSKGVYVVRRRQGRSIASPSKSSSEPNPP